jgi:hypothetical protein
VNELGSDFGRVTQLAVGILASLLPEPSVVGHPFLDGGAVLESEGCFNDSDVAHVGVDDERLGHYAP